MTRRWVGGAVALAMLALPAIAAAERHQTTFRAPASALQPVTCVAVLPFENLSDQAGAGDAFADLLSTELLQSGRFQVMDRAEAGRILATRGIYAGGTVDAATARALGDVLGVQAVVLGEVSDWRYAPSLRRGRPAEPAIGVTTKLVDVKTGDTLWGATFAGNPMGFFASRRPPLYLAGQRVALDLSRGLVTDSGENHPAGQPCWATREQSVLATLSPMNRPQATPTPASLAPTPAPTAVAMITPLPAATPTPNAAPTPPPIALSPSQNALLAQMKPGAGFVLQGVTFVGLTEKLQPASDRVLGDLATVLKAHPEAKIQVQSHMDPTDAAPVPTSQKRAESVVAKLIALGASSAQLDPKGMGGSKSLFPSFVEAMKAKNRRIEILVQAAPTMPVAPAGGTAPVAGAPITARVKVLAAKGMSAATVKLANALKQNGVKVVAIASVPEAHNTTLIYFAPKFKDDAGRIARQITVKVGAPKLVPSNGLGAAADVEIVVGADLR